jgi:hypothetical protein
MGAWAQTCKFFGSYEKHLLLIEKGAFHPLKKGKSLWTKWLLPDNIQSFCKTI